MWYKNHSCIVTVYNFNIDGSVLIYSPSLAGKQNGNGWIKVKLKELIPLEYYNEHSNNFQSKTVANRMKARLTLTSAVWTCTDGTKFTDFKEAAAHEYELYNKEKKEN